MPKFQRPSTLTQDFWNRLLSPLDKCSEKEAAKALVRAVELDLTGETKYPTRWSDPIDGPVRCPGSWTPDWKERLAELG